MTKDEILQRISQVNADLEKVKDMPTNADRHSESLRMYREYLLEQLAEIKDD
jgi:hypothetical protein